MFSCLDELDQNPPHKVSDGSFWQTPEHFKQYCNGFYNWIPSPGRDTDSDIAWAQSFNTISSGANLPVEDDGSWNGAYDKIRATTYLLEKASERDDVDRWVGEAKFFRAMQYFNLVKRFGDVPLVKKVLDTESEELQAVRTNRVEIIKFCIEDLEDVVKKLPKRSELNDVKEIGRITKGAAQAFLGRIALFEATWQKYNKSNTITEFFQKAKDASEAVIDSDEYIIYTALGDGSYRDIFWNPARDDENLNNKTEFVLARKYEVDIRTHSTSQSSVQNMGPTHNLVKLYCCSDGLPIDKSPLFKGEADYWTIFENRDLRLLNTVAKEGDNPWTHGGEGGITPGDGHFQWAYAGYRVWKGNGEGDDRRQQKEHNDMYFIRYAEVLLNFAEACYELNGVVTDAELNKSVNLLRNRAGIAVLSNSFVSANALDMKDELRRERTVELALEGFRLNDLKRWGVATTVMQEPLLGLQWDNSTWKNIADITKITNFGTDANGYLIMQPVSERKFQDKHLLFPLPTSQIKLNINLLPNNPGWE
jgi:hypothetical protein